MKTKLFAKVTSLLLVVTLLLSMFTLTGVAYANSDVLSTVRDGWHLDEKGNYFYIDSFGIRNITPNAPNREAESLTPLALGRYVDQRGQEFVLDGFPNA